VDFRGRTTIRNLNSSEWLDGNSRAMIFVHPDGLYV
jgi:hypothetical protein